MHYYIVHNTVTQTVAVKCKC